MHIRWYQSRSTFELIKNHDENRGAVSGNHLYNGDQGMHAIRDQLDCHSVTITTYEGLIQTGQGLVTLMSDSMTECKMGLRH